MDKDLLKIKKDCLKEMLSLYNEARAGHIGASLSCLDLLVYLFFYKMRKEDKFVLSKGHAACALYTVLNKAGKISDELLHTYYKDGTFLAAHPPCGNKLEGIVFGTGSLGHGLSLAAGIALSSKLNNKKFNVYCIISEGDLNEGSTWEALLFSAQHKLNNLTIIVDNNNLQGFGSSSDVLNLEPLADKLKSFNLDVAVVSDGNDFSNIHSVFSDLAGTTNHSKPKCIIAKTTKGCGVSYMENNMEWHYLSMNQEQYELAIKEVSKI